MNFQCDTPTASQVIPLKFPPSTSFELLGVKMNIWKNLFTIILLCVSVSNAYSESSHPPINTLFVWEAKGLDVHQKPEYDSTVIAHIEYGNPLKIMAITKIKTNFEILNKEINFSHEPFKIKNDVVRSIQGQWVKVHVNGKNGYVPNTLLSRLPGMRCERINAELSNERKCETPSEFSKRIFGQKSFVKNAKDETTTTNDYRFGRGVTINEVNRENSGKHLWVLPGYSQRDGILIARLLYDFLPTSPLKKLTEHEIDYKSDEITYINIHTEKSILKLAVRWSD